MKKVIVKVPHRISGFFEIVDEFKGVKIKDPERIGSRGAGFNLNSFGTTEINIEESNDKFRTEYKIYINDEELNEVAETSNYVLNYCLKYNQDPKLIKIVHNFDLPVGCGFGASGSGALGCAYGLDYLLDLKFSSFEKGRIAHIAEVINRTGLGTVCGQLGGGLSMLLEPGYPCTFKRIKVPDDLIVICGSFGKIETKSILVNPQLNLKIKIAGKKALNYLIKNPNIQNFVKVSYIFVLETEILNILNLSKTEELLNDLNKIDILGASMNQLGRSVFAFCNKYSFKHVEEVFKSYEPDLKIFRSTINENNKILIQKS